MEIPAPTSKEQNNDSPNYAHCSNGNKCKYYCYHSFFWSYSSNSLEGRNSLVERAAVYRSFSTSYHRK